MNRLNSINFDVLRRRRVLVSIAVVVVVALVFYFAWWTPESNKLSSVNTQKQEEATTISNLESTLATDRAEGSFASKYHAFLTFFGSQVPVQPEAGQLYTTLGRLASSDRVDLSSVTANTTVAAVPPSHLSSIPVTMAISGSHVAVLKFLSDLYSFPRLITISSISPSPQGASSSYNILSHDTVPFTMSISGTAYFTGTVAPAG